MHLPCDKAYDGSVDRYLEAKLGFPAHFFPTYLGLHLAEDFELGTRYDLFVFQKLNLKLFFQFLNLRVKLVDRVQPFS